ncbi:Molybdopterin binding protein [Basidiobolus meristosporus CBS 931.73]|uniref:Molybdopterin binding protein n=1 Tax=Basidiobolus meristosporus CBS 931.73 TaxID=1314790 RepID=A0A1Y1XZD0_9FUNG|nr:Molybdopterin binding protein [Basidiobolus meristosporus CBS 931.73]|eukprot:ORX91005.1 Molybdopterin binding protein [Basidiobolus meristosporus CBS 931.73]
MATFWLRQSRAVRPHASYTSRSSLNALLSFNREYSTNQARSKTVAACIIGDEILSGKTRDSNSHFLAQYCFDLGLDMRRIEVVPDVTEDIVESVRRLSANHDYVFTSGGIGPTHDDITYEAIAEAFNQKVAYHEPTLARMQQISPHLELTLPRKRMALLPEKAQVFYTSHSLWVPLAIVSNVYILPGVPKLFKLMLEDYRPSIATELSGTAKFHRKLIGTLWMESKIAQVLSEAQNNVGAEVKIGSYPKWKNDTVNVVISFVGKDLSKVESCADLVKTKIEGFDMKDNDNPV